MKFSFIQFNWLYFLIGINCLIFIVAFVVQSKLGFDVNLFYLFGGLVPSKVFTGSLWLLVTANFFHLDILHFAFNMISLYKIGEIVNYYYDGRKLFTTFILGGISGTVLSYFSAYLTHSDILSLGASAGIFALVGLLLGGTLRRNRYGMDLPFSAAEILPFAIISFLFGFLPGMNINNWAHLGGVVGGVFLGLILNNSMAVHINRIEKFVGESLFVISFIFFIVSYVALIANAYHLVFA